MTGKRYASVWDAIENTPQETENMKIRGALMEKLIAFIDDSGMPQGEIAERLGVTQPRISDLVRGKIDLFSIDALVNMLVAAGLKVDFFVVPPARTPARSTRKTSAAASSSVRAGGSRKSGTKAAASSSVRAGGSRKSGTKAAAKVAAR